MASCFISHFLLLRQNKVAKEGVPGLPPTSWVPCVARPVRLPHKLARSALRPRAQTYSSEFPDQPALLSGAQGKENQWAAWLVGRKKIQWGKRELPDRLLGIITPVLLKMDIINRLIQP